MLDDKEQRSVAEALGDAVNEYSENNEVHNHEHCKPHSGGSCPQLAACVRLEFLRI